jgi:hypothetical protein
VNVLRGALLGLVSAGAWLAAPAAVAAQDSTSVPPLPAHADNVCAGCPPKRPLIAVAMGLATNVFINRMDAWILNVHEPPPDGYYTRVSPRSWGVNIRKGWVWDTDAFPVNMFAHPYQGGTYFRAGRNNGLDFWESAPLTFLGSVEWEYFGETTLPSLNDLYNTGFGGIVTGESFYRLVALIRDNQARGVGRILRELAAFPLDPSGSVKRLLAGEFTRVYANPGEHAPPPLALQVQAGVRLALDSGFAGKRSAAGTLVAELSYGDAYARPYTRPFDVFLMRALISPGPSPVGEMRIAGRLYGHEFTDPTAGIRAIFTVRQKLEYTENPAYKFGGQSVEAGVVAGFALGRRVDVRTESYVEGIMLGAVDAQGAADTTGIAGSPRTYDFGPGVGLDLSASLRVGGFPVIAARYHWSMIHSVSGSAANHFTQLPSIELTLPVTGTFGLGAYGGWYARRSAYAGRPGEVKTYPDLRAYLVWQTHPRPAAPEPQ